MLSFIGKVIKSIIDKNKDSTNQVIKPTVETTKNNNRTCQTMFAPGIESNPANGIQLFVMPFGGAQGNLSAIGGYNQNITPEANQGGIRIFSTDAQGNAIKAKIWFKNDGKISIEATDDIEIKTTVATVNIKNNGDIEASNTLGNYKLNGTTGQFNVNNGNFTVDA